MALTILDRPIGCRLSATPNNNYLIFNAGYGDAVLAEYSGSGLADGDKIYIYESFTSYNGFWEVVGFGPAQFKLRRYAGADYLTAGESGSQAQLGITIYKCIGDVDYSCIHLPIVYTLQSGKWPTNYEDAIRNIVGFHNDNGNVRITLDGIIDADALDWIKISNSTEEDLDGPFQILTKYSPTQFTIDAPYSIAQGSAYTYSSATAQKYYNNYAVNVRIYGGLHPEHLWAGVKPYELITTLSIPPGANNTLMVNVAEILKEKLNIQSNRPNYDSMPYDLDRFCEFYISYAEQYDDSDGTDVATFVSSYQSDYDFFQGVAVDAELPFKNRYSGFLSEYTPISTTALSKLLNNPGGAWAWGGKYFDVSLLSNVYEFNLIQQPYDEHGNAIGSPVSTSNPALGPGFNDSRGVFRIQVGQIGSEAYQIIKFQDQTTSDQITEEYRIDFISDCAQQYIYLTWKNNLGGFNYWLFTANKDYSQNIIETQNRERNIYPQWPHSFGEHQDTINQETYRSSFSEMTVRAEALTQQQIEFIKTIRLSSLVQQMTTKYDRRTMIVDNASFRVRTDAEGLSSIEFVVRDTAQNPSPSL